MRNLIIVLIMTSAIATFAQGTQVKVILYRNPKLPPGIVGVNLYAGDMALGKLEANNIISYTCPPGKVLFHGKTEEEGSVEMDLTSAAKYYYIEVGFQLDGGPGRPLFRPVTIQEGKAALEQIGPESVINVKAQQVEAPKAQAQVIFYRDSNIPVGVTDFDIQAGEKTVGRLREKMLLSFFSDPGLQTFSAKTENQGTIAINMKANGITYVKVGTEVGPTGGRPVFIEVPKEQAATETKKYSSKTVGGVKAPSEDEFGIKLGMNSSMFSASINSIGSSVGGFHIGVYSKTSIGQNFYFRAEVYYSSQGQSDDYRALPNGPSIGTTTTTLKYVNIPLLFEVGKVVSFQFGPQFGVVLSGNEKGNINGSAVNDDLKSISKSDVSAVAGLGINPSKHFHLGVRYHYGLTSVFSKPAGAPSGYPDINNRVVHIYAAVSF